MEKIELRLLELKKLGAGDEQCNDCLRLQYPAINSMTVCKKCISDIPAFTALVAGLMANASSLTQNI